MKPKYEYYKDKNGEWRWRVIAKNGEIIGASSEGFYDKSYAVSNLSLLYATLHELIGEPA